MEPMWDRLPELTIPVTLITGERDEKFRALAERDGERLPNAQHVTISEHGPRAATRGPVSSRASDSPFGVALFVGLRVVVAVEVLFEQLVERGAVAHDRVG